MSKTTKWTVAAVVVPILGFVIQAVLSRSPGMTQQANESPGAVQQGATNPAGPVQQNTMQDSPGGVQYNITIYGFPEARKAAVEISGEPAEPDKLSQEYLDGRFPYGWSLAVSDDQFLRHFVPPNENQVEFLWNDSDTKPGARLSPYPGEVAITPPAMRFGTVQKIRTTNLSVIMPRKEGEVQIVSLLADTPDPRVVEVEILSVGDSGIAWAVGIRRP